MWGTAAGLVEQAEQKAEVTVVELAPGGTWEEAGDMQRVPAEGGDGPEHDTHTHSHGRPVEVDWNEVTAGEDIFLIGFHVGLFYDRKTLRYMMQQDTDD